MSFGSNQASLVSLECCALGRVLDTDTLDIPIRVRWQNLDQYPDQKHIFHLDVSGQLIFKGNSLEEEGNTPGPISAASCM